MASRGATPESIKAVLESLERLANVRNKTDSERQADYDQFVANILKSLESERGAVPEPN